jgi:membrane-associated phospholipid phosphatase
LSDFPLPFRFRRIAPAVAAAVVALLAIPLADYTGLRIYDGIRWLPLTRVFAAAEQFATVPCIALIMCVIWVQDPRRRGVLPYLLIALLLSGNLNTAVKLTTGRVRPTHSILLSGNAREDLEAVQAQYPEAKVQIGHGDQWLLFSTTRPLLNDAFNSFPSGHANAAFVLAAFLAALYPRGRFLWLIAALLCAFARVRFRRHFTEDVVFGGALGWIIASWVFSWRWPARIVSRFRKGEAT